MVKFPGIDKHKYEHWSDGAPVYVNPADVTCIEGREHGYHSFRPKQEYTVVHLRGGVSVEVMANPDYVDAMLWPKPAVMSKDGRDE